MRVLLTGSRGMLGRAISAQLEGMADIEPLLPPRAELDLLDADATRVWMQHERPDAIIHAAGRVGGIASNISDPLGYLRDNTAIGVNLIGAAMDAGVSRLLNVGSSCMYPRNWRQPLVEDDLLRGELEPTNEGYALAKLTAERLCRYAAAEGHAYRTVIPSNLYGPHDHFAPDRAHLVAAAIGKAHRAKAEGAAAVEVWGDGTARREFTFVDDVARWLTHVLAKLEELPVTVNAGIGDDHSVREYYEAVCEVVQFKGGLTFDDTRPVGMRQKLMDSSLAREHGWEPTTPLVDGLRATYAWYTDNVVAAASGAA